MSNVDVLIIGGGQAGIPLAQALDKAGKRVVLAERRHLGGSCVNFGCTPTKAVLASARVAQLARRGREFGLEIPEVGVDFGAVLARAKTVLLESRTSLRTSLEASGVTLLRGHARFTGRGGAGFCLNVNGQEIAARQVVVNTGTRDLLPPTEGLDTVALLHAGNWLEHSRLPEHLVVLGGGYIGVEMSQFYRRMGSQVTVIEGGAQILAREDEDVASELQRQLENEGVTFKVGAKVTRVARAEDGVALTLEGEAAPLRASHLFVAVGRQPNTDDLGLERVGLATDDQGFLEVDETLATAVEGIFAAGDVRGGAMFTHSAHDDYLVLEAQLLGKGNKTTARLVPYAVFTEPELGRVGMSERQAKDAGKRVRVARYQLKKNGKAREIGAPEGVIKLVAEGDKLLGAAVLAAEASEIVHTYVTLMNTGAKMARLRQALFIHPTLSEAVKSALEAFEEA